MALHVADLRVAYKYGALLESCVKTNPFEQFGEWFQEAVKAAKDGLLYEPNAMTVCTASIRKREDGTVEAHPTARIVLLKGFDQRGFVFYTNYNSKKSSDLKSNPRVALVFYWDRLERSVRIEGTAEMVSQEESEAYFTSRPKGSQLGAWASPNQSSVVESRQELDDRLAALEQQYLDKPMAPKPEFWGGWRITPEKFEFWQGRDNRLHDRLQFTKGQEGDWVLKRLSP